MSDKDKGQVGTIGWVDLTVDAAESVRDFYRQVVGWESNELDMGGYSDYCMNTPGEGKTVAGICHARGTNTDLPAQWLVYITVEDVDQSAKRCLELGGAVLTGPRSLGEARFCVVRDPAGAVAALFEPGK